MSDHEISPDFEMDLGSGTSSSSPDAPASAPNGQAIASDVPELPGSPIQLDLETADAALRVAMQQLQAAPQQVSAVSANDPSIASPRSNDVDVKANDAQPASATSPETELKTTACLRPIQIVLSPAPVGLSGYMKLPRSKVVQSVWRDISLPSGETVYELGLEDGRVVMVRHIFLKFL